MRKFVLVLLAALSICSNIATAKPDSDTLDAAQVLIRWLAATHDLSPEKSSHYFVTIDGDDMPEAILSSLRRHTGIDLLPGSERKEAGLADLGQGRTLLTIDKPRLRADGDFDVPWSAICGGLCGEGNTVVMRHDRSGWHVASTSPYKWVS